MQKSLVIGTKTPDLPLVTVAPVAPSSAVSDSGPSARSLDDVATTLRGILATGDSVPWACGKVVALAHEANGPTIEAPADYRRKRLREMCKVLSGETGIGTNTLIERFDVYDFYGDDLPAEYADLNYSQFREVWRHEKDIKKAYHWLDQANEHGYRAHELRDAIRLSRGETVPPKTQHKSFKVDVTGFAGYWTAQIAMVDVDYDELSKLKDKPGVVFTLTARWPDSAPTAGGGE